MDTYHLNEGRNVTQQVEKWIRWIPPINGKLKSNFDGSTVQNNNALGRVIRDSNDIIKMVLCRYMRNSSIIVIKCITLRDIYILVVKNKKILDLKI